VHHIADRNWIRCQITLLFVLDNKIRIFLHWVYIRNTCVRFASLNFKKGNPSILWSLWIFGLVCCGENHTDSPLIQSRMIFDVRNISKIFHEKEWSGNRAWRPKFNIDAWLSEAGILTRTRVCKRPRALAKKEKNPSGPDPRLQSARFCLRAVCSPDRVEREREREGKRWRETALENRLLDACIRHAS